MKRKEANEILSYVAQNIISPLAFDDTPAREVWLRLSGHDFNKFSAFVETMVEDDEEESSMIARMICDSYVKKYFK